VLIVHQQVDELGMHEDLVAACLAFLVDVIDISTGCVEKRKILRHILRPLGAPPRYSSCL
jgi:hypothetical protein